jgi:hypothetical protein
MLALSYVPLVCSKSAPQRTKPCTPWPSSWLMRAAASRALPAQNGDYKRKTFRVL